MQDSSSPANRLFISDNAFVLGRDTAVVLCVVVGDVGIATDTGGLLVGTNVATHVVVFVMGTLHVVVTDDLTLCIGCVGRTALLTLVITRLGSQYWLASAAGGITTVSSTGVHGSGAAVV